MSSITSEPSPGSSVENEPTETDEALIAALARGDSNAFSKLYDRHAPQVYALAMRVMRSQHDAESIVSDIFFDVWRNPDRYDASRGSCRAYLLMRTRSRAIDHLRSATTRTRKTTDASDHKTEERRQQEAAESPYAKLLASEQRTELQAAVAELTLEQREPLLLSFFEGLTHLEIAERLNKPLGTVKTRIRLGLQKLRTALCLPSNAPQEEPNDV